MALLLHLLLFVTTVYRVAHVFHVCVEHIYAHWSGNKTPQYLCLTEGGVREPMGPFLFCSSPQWCCSLAPTPWFRAAGDEDGQLLFMRGGAAGCPLTRARITGKGLTKWASFDPWMYYTSMLWPCFVSAAAAPSAVQEEKLQGSKRRDLKSCN